MFKIARARHWHMRGPEQLQPEQHSLMFQFCIEFRRNSRAVI